MQNNFPRILIGAPTSNLKAYCFESWLDNALLTNYPGEWKIVLYDNSDQASVDYQNAYYKSKYGDGGKFECFLSDIRFCKHMVAKLAKGHNDVRKYAIDNNYDYLWHLESDIYPKPHFLQELVLKKLPVVGAIYYRDLGRFRRLMLQQRLFRSHNNIKSQNCSPDDDLHFVDGKTKEASHIGLGCMLIRKDILERTPFRYVEGVKVFSDSFWAEDMYKAKIKVMADTSLICSHLNSNWMLLDTKENKII